MQREASLLKVMAPSVPGLSLFEIENASPGRMPVMVRAPGAVAGLGARGICSAQ